MARLEARFCDYCGSELSALPAAPARSHGPHGDLAARFAALDRWEGLEAARSRPPSTGGLTMGLGVALVFGLVWVSVALGMATVFPGWMALVPGGMAVFGVFFFGKLARDFVRFTQAPLEPRLALVADERSHTSGGRHGTSTRYHISLQDERGERREYVTSAPVAATAAVGDLGLAWVKGQHVVGFERAPV